MWKLASCSPPPKTETVQQLAIASVSVETEDRTLQVYCFTPCSGERVYAKFHEQNRERLSQRQCSSLELHNRSIEQSVPYVSSQSIKGFELEFEVLHERTYKNAKRKNVFFTSTSEPTVAASLICKEKTLCPLFLVPGLLKA